MKRELTKSPVANHNYHQGYGASETIQWEQMWRTTHPRMPGRAVAAPKLSLLV